MAKTKKPNGVAGEAWLTRELYDDKNIQHAATRDGYGEGLVDAGRQNKNVIVLCADVTESTRCAQFKKNFPNRFVQIGVSEQSMPSIASGMSFAGKIPFINAYASFSPGRNWEQIRTCVALQKANVKVVGSHAGVNVGEDGATHQMLEDIALMRVLPNMNIVVPCDALEARKATVAAAKLKAPCYIRLAREKSPVFTTQKTPFKIGRAIVLRNGYDATIIGCGPLLYDALVASETLSKNDGIECRVVNMHTVKPLDIETVITVAKQTGAIVTIEEAMVAGGLGGAIAETLCSFAPVPLEQIGVRDRFGESGKPDELKRHFMLTAESIVEAVKKAVARKICYNFTLRPQSK